MTAFKMNKLVGAMAATSLFALIVMADGTLSAYTTTEAPVSYEVGSATSDGMLHHTWSVCSIVHNTICEASISMAATVAPSASQPYLPPPGAGETSVPTGEQQQQPSASNDEHWPAQSETVPAGGSEVPPTDIAAPTTAPGESAPPAVSIGEAVPSGSKDTYPSGSGSGSKTGAQPTITGNDGEGDDPSGTGTGIATPTATANGAMVMIKGSVITVVAAAMAVALVF